MDLIYTNESLFRLGILSGYTADIDVANEKDFSITSSTYGEKIPLGGYWFIQDTEYGGVVDHIEVKTSSNEIVYKGRNWRGILSSRILCPDKGYDFITVDGYVGEIIESLLSRVGLSGLFTVKETYEWVESFQFDRYCTLYDGLVKMLDSINSILYVNFDGTKVVLEPVVVRDFSDDLTYGRDNSINFSLEKNKNSVNHLICLGGGNLRERYVIHLFTDANGGVQPYAITENPIYDSDYILDESNKVILDLDEVVDVYDYDNASDVTNYVMTTSAPKGWGSNYSNYFMLEITENDDGTVDQKYENVKGTSKDTYQALTKAPSDWASNYGDYYYLSDSEYKGVSDLATTTKYNKQSRQPNDWKSNYGSYYEFYSDGVTSEYRSISGNQWNSYTKQTRIPTDWYSDYNNYYCIGNIYSKNGSKTWKKNTYYKHSNDKYTKLGSKPKDWAKKYKNYYVAKSGYVSVAGTGKNKNIAPTWRKNKFYTKISHTSTPKWSGRAVYTAVEVTTCPAWGSKTFYEKITNEVGPAWVKNTYYKAVTDHYASLVSGGIDRLAELYSTDASEVSLEDFDCNIGDIVGGKEWTTGYEIVERVTNMIIKIENDIVTVSYTIGG